MRRAGFTLLEVLVSLMIFSVVSIALISVLTGAVRIFRAGESARAAHDESMAAIAQLDEDLARLVPPGDGGFLYLRVRDNDPEQPAIQPDPSRNMVLAFKIRNPDPEQVSTEVTGEPSSDAHGNGARLIVCWFVDAEGWLNRTTQVAADSDGDGSTVKELEAAAKALDRQGRLSRDCLYFGADLSLDQPVDPLDATSRGVRADTSWSDCLPQGTDRFCTEPTSTGSRQPFPRALRVSLTLTGGSRNRQTGYVVGDAGGGIRITGVGQVPVGAGAMARIGAPAKPGDPANVEWVRYDGAANGVLTFQGGRPATTRRTTQVAHGRGELVEFGTTYTVVRTIPR